MLYDQRQLGKLEHPTNQDKSSERWRMTVAAPHLLQVN
jgi:hypothetical protein